MKQLDKLEFDEVINMKHPEKWRDTVNPYSLPYKNFSLLEIIGCPHADNDVFQVKGIYEQKEYRTFVHKKFSFHFAMYAL